MINVVHLSSNPISGSPWELNKLLEDSGIVRSRLIQGTSFYGETQDIFKREFPKDLIWKENEQECLRIIKDADILHCHNTIFPRNLKDYLSPSQKIILQIYSVDRTSLNPYLIQDLSIADEVVIAEQPWQKRVYHDISQKYLPLVKTLFTSSDKEKLDIPVITYAPTNKYSDHLYSKGYNEVIKIIKELKKEHNFHFQLIEGVPYLDNLELKKKSDIIIDDVMNEDVFHGTSIEAACVGAIALTNHSSPEYPFIKTNITTLKDTLLEYLKDPKKLEIDKCEISKWRNKRYTKEKLINAYERFYIKTLKKNSGEAMNKNISDKQKIFQVLHDWLEEHEIFHFLAFGTALVAWRDNNFEIDVDFGLFYEDKWKVKKLLETDPPKGIMINNLWRGEFTFRFDDKEYPKADFFFFEDKGDYYRCGLSIRNKMAGVVTQEKGLKFSKECLKGFTNFKFAGRTVKIPKNIEKYFDENYHQWRTPDAKPIGWGGRPCADHEFREYAIIVPTFLRDDKIKECVTSFLEYYDSNWVKFYIGDQNKDISPEMQKWYKELKAMGHELVRLPYNCGLSYARNKLIEKTKEPYILVIDDDFVCTKNTDITKLKDVLETEENLGIVGGSLNGNNPYLGWLYHNPSIGKILKISTSLFPKKEYNAPLYPYNPRQAKYIYSDIVLNFFLAKREVFDNFGWDENLPLAEHSDAFLRLKETKWKVAYCEEVSCIHNNKNCSKEYRDFRSNINREIGVERFCKKWGINSLEDIVNITSKNAKIIELPKPTHPPENKEPQPPQPPAKRLKIEESYVPFLSDLCKNYIKIVILTTTCSEVLNLKEIKGELNVYLGSLSLDKLRKIGYTIDKKFIEKDGVKINYSRTKPNEIKKYINSHGFDFWIPTPVKPYLINCGIKD